MKKILSYLFEHGTLSREKAKEVLVQIGKGVYNEHEVTAFMTVYLMRSITLEELLGFRDALLELCVAVHFDQPVIDIVGTGGDGKNTFNISTLSCFIVAGAGQKVAKHGNYGASSVSGASNLMELVGYRFKNDNESLQKEIAEAGICFLHAPLFHPALKVVGPIRRNLAMRTFFNMLGPLVNPATPSFQLIGVFNPEMLRMYSYLLQQTEKPFTLIHGLDGYDEISLTTDTKIVNHEGEQILTPIQLGKRWVEPEALHGGNTVEEAAAIFLRILKGEGTWSQNAVVLANASMALYGSRAYPDYDSAYLAAVDSLESGKAKAAFEKLIQLQ